EGQIIEANEAFLRMVGYSREDLLSGRVRWTDLTPAEWRDWGERAVAQLEATGIAQPFQKEDFRKDGSRVPVLVCGAMFEGSANEGTSGSTRCRPATSTRRGGGGRGSVIGRNDDRDSVVAV